MLLGDCYLIQLPQPPDLPLAALEYLQVKVSDCDSRLERLSNKTAGLVTFSPEKRLEVLSGECRQWVVVGEKGWEVGRSLGLNLKGVFNVRLDSGSPPCWQLFLQHGPK